MVFLLHGYNSEADDLNKLYSCILRHSPKTKIHSCESIENIHDKGVFELGEIVAKECKSAIDKQIAINRFGKISFVGFSFGGLIFRAAIEHLGEYKKHFHSYVSLASPHFGCVYSESTLFSMGIWAFSKFTSSPIIQELRFGDAFHYSDCALYRLAHLSGMKSFENILL